MTWLVRLCTWPQGGGSLEAVWWSHGSDHLYLTSHTAHYHDGPSSRPLGPRKRSFLFLRDLLQAPCPVGSCHWSTAKLSLCLDLATAA